MRLAVRALHNGVARQDDVTASVRPPRTTRGDLVRMVRDIERKLLMEGRPAVCELGVGTGILALPLARQSSRFIGIDFAEEAVEVLRERIAAAHLDTAQAVVMDVIEASEADWEALGQFDRVLVYAALHYVETLDQADLFVSRALSLVAPGGRALLGNLPVSGRPVRLNLIWAIRGLGYRAWSRLSQRGPRLEAGPAVSGLCTLQAERLEAIVRGLGMESHWHRPAPGTPMFAHRMDLVVTRPSA